MYLKNMCRWKREKEYTGKADAKQKDGERCIIGFLFFCLATAYNLGIRLLELPVIVYKIKNVLSKNDGKGKKKIINII